MASDFDDSLKIYGAKQHRTRRILAEEWEKHKDAIMLSYEEHGLTKLRDIFSPHIDLSLRTIYYSLALYLDPDLDMNRTKQYQYQLKKWNVATSPAGAIVRTKKDCQKGSVEDEQQFNAGSLIAPHQSSSTYHYDDVRHCFDHEKAIERAREPVSPALEELEGSTDDLTPQG